MLTCCAPDSCASLRFSFLARGMSVELSGRSSIVDRMLANDQTTYDALRGDVRRHLEHDELRRSYLMLDVSARQSGGHISYYDSPQAFADMADRLLDLGFTELVLYYPALLSQRSVFETIANDVIPALRESRKPSE